jgi:hypothetical protein
MVTAPYGLLNILLDHWPISINIFSLRQIIMKLPYSFLHSVSFPSPYIGYNIAVFQTVGNCLSLILFNNLVKILISSSFLTIIFSGLCHYTIKSCFFNIIIIIHTCNEFFNLLFCKGNIQFLHIIRAHYLSLP